MIREAARVVLLDERDRVLLFGGFDPAEPDRGSWWFTPGGGIDPGESLEEAALRELAEETGIRDITLGPCLWTRLGSFWFEGVLFEQRSWYFMAYTSDTGVDTSGFTEVERRSIVDHRWWSVDELRNTTDVVYPPALSSLLESVLREGRP
jgi:8-oxo-dGTP pyrophosphatase MutT (NUDIX family)